MPSPACSWAGTPVPAAHPAARPVPEAWLTLFHTRALHRSLAGLVRRLQYCPCFGRSPWTEVWARLEGATGDGSHGSLCYGTRRGLGTHPETASSLQAETVTSSMRVGLALWRGLGLGYTSPSLLPRPAQLTHALGPCTCWLCCSHGICRQAPPHPPAA